MAGLDGYTDPRLTTVTEEINKNVHDLVTMRENAKVASDGVTLEFEGTEKEKWAKTIEAQRELRKKYEAIREETLMMQEISLSDKEEKTLDDFPSEERIEKELRKLRGDAEYQQKALNQETPGAVISNFLEQAGIAGRQGEGKNYFDQSILSRREIAFTVHWGKGTNEFKKANGDKSIDIRTAKDAKSLFTSSRFNPAQETSAPFNGYTGFNCGFVMDPTIALIRDSQHCVENIITQRPFNGHTLRFTREAPEDNNADAVFETIYEGQGLDENDAVDGTKPESFLGFLDVTVDIAKVATHIRLSSDVLADCPSLMNQIDMILMRMVRNVRRAQLLVGSGVAPNARGLYFQPGTLTGEFRHPDSRGEETDTVADFVRRAITDLQIGGYVPDGLLMSPIDVEKIALLKDEIGRYLFPDCVTNNIWCVKICPEPDNPVGQFALGEFMNNWIMLNREDITLRMGYIANQFIENALTIVCETRFADFLYEPEGVYVGEGIV